MANVRDEILETAKEAIAKVGWKAAAITAICELTNDLKELKSKAATDKLPPDEFVGIFTTLAILMVVFSEKVGVDFSESPSQETMQ